MVEVRQFGGRNIMSKIRVLDTVTIDKIAAGEVIERPASVVKELVENAIDAKATAIVVEIEEGGTTMIRIADNGCGIEREDVKSAFLRHSTSKIRSVEDLAHIGSLGFRGEALSSIAAVSQVELITNQIPDQRRERRRHRGYRFPGRNHISDPAIVLQCSCQTKIFKDARNRSKPCRGSDDPACAFSSGDFLSVHQ